MSRKLISTVSVTLLGLVALITGTVPAHAQTFIQTDTTLDSSNPIAGSAYVGFNSNQSIKTSPTVNLVAGGSVSDYLNVFNSSVVNVSGGSIGGVLDVHDSATINVSGGNVGSLIADGSSTISISGGSFGKLPTTDDNIFLANDVVLNLIGNNLAVTFLTLGGGNVGGYDFALSGTLADGTDLQGYVLNTRLNYTGQVNLLSPPAVTPEPGSIVILLSGMMGAGFAFRRRKPIFSGE